MGVSGDGRNFFEYPILFQERVKLRTSNLAGTFTGSMRTKVDQKFGRKGSVGYPGTAQFLEYIWLSHEQIKLWTSNLQVYSQGPSKQKPFKNWREKRVWAYPGTAEIFAVHDIISGTGKATNFKFCTLIFSIDRNKRAITNFGKSSQVRRTLETFQGTRILGASRGRLCDSSAFLLLDGLTFVRNITLCLKNRTNFETV